MILSEEDWKVVVIFWFILDTYSVFLCDRSNAGGE
jgi:hypothetical protein